MPLVSLISAGVWVAVFFATRYVSLASILAAACLPILSYLFNRGTFSLWVTGLIGAFVVFRHRANIGRLLGGTEKRFERRKPGDKP
jgi:glycerol-3-phosphate acyltransferase PlsY